MKYVLCCAALALAVTLSGCGGEGQQPVTRLTVRPAALTLRVGETYRLAAETDAANVTWSAENAEVASVDGEGNVTAHSPGACRVTAAAGGRSAVCALTVTREAGLPEQDAAGLTYRFTVEADGLYDLSLSNLGAGTANFSAPIASGGVAPIASAFSVPGPVVPTVPAFSAPGPVASVSSNLTASDVFRVDGGYATRLRSKRAEDGGMWLATRHLTAGEHTLRLDFPAGVPDMFGSARLAAASARFLGGERLRGGAVWLDTLYRETGVNTEEENFVGYVETEGWQDIWTHCQYLPVTMAMAEEFGTPGYAERVRTIAEQLLIGKMYRPDGAVYTVYRARDDVFQVSIEPDMPRNQYELWRGNAAFAEEMMNCYLYFEEQRYLDYAKSAMDYVLQSWAKSPVKGLFGSFYNRYSAAPLADMDVMSSGRMVMVLAQLGMLTGESRYEKAAVQQAKLLLKAQETPYPALDGLFASAVSPSGGLNEFRHGNAYANALNGLAWVYRATGDETYRAAIGRAVSALDTVYDDERGMLIVMDGRPLPDHSGTGAAYMAGRISQALTSAAVFIGDDSAFRQAERVLEYAFGRNYGDFDMRDATTGAYRYGVNYTGASNIETSGEIYLAQVQYDYLKRLWKV